MSRVHEPRVVILAGRGPMTNIVFHHVSADLNVVGVVQEDPVRTSQFLKKRAARLGCVTVAGQLAFRAAVQAPLGVLSRGRRTAIIEENGLNLGIIPSSALAHVQSVNAPETRQLIKELAPDVILIQGTRIIGRRLLDEFASVPFVNVHLGITPAYRCVHGGYWALAEGEPEKFGSTIHLVDRGIDTGGVLRHCVATPTAHNNFATYPLVQLAAALPHLTGVLRRVAAGDLRTIEVDDPSRAWSHPTLWEYAFRFASTGVR